MWHLSNSKAHKNPDTKSVRKYVCAFEKSVRKYVCALEKSVRKYFVPVQDSDLSADAGANGPKYNSAVSCTNCFPNSATIQFTVCTAFQFAFYATK
jgi:hypothetical protein